MDGWPPAGGRHPQRCAAAGGRRCAAVGRRAAAALRRPPGVAQAGRDPPRRPGPHPVGRTGRGGRGAGAGVSRRPGWGPGPRRPGAVLGGARPRRGDGPAGGGRRPGQRHQLRGAAPRGDRGAGVRHTRAEHAGGGRGRGGGRRGQRPAARRRRLRPKRPGRLRIAVRAAPRRPGAPPSLSAGRPGDGPGLDVRPLRDRGRGPPRVFGPRPAPGCVRRQGDGGVAAGRRPPAQARHPLPAPAPGLDRRGAGGRAVGGRRAGFAPPPPAAPGARGPAVLRGRPPRGRRRHRRPRRPQGCDRLPEPVRGARGGRRPVRGPPPAAAAGADRAARGLANRVPPLRQLAGAGSSPRRRMRPPPGPCAGPTGCGR